ncbi:glycerol-3-phosphate dehydrogenase [Bacteroidia bacterium]|nr:glycerol-3-phosphate dehydrogenase [Bacteroidia bacterium]
MNIAILGSGTFGTALANVITPEREVTLYTIESDVVEDININQRNTKYFPNKLLGKNIHATDRFADIADADLVFVAIPSHVLVNVFTQKQFRKDTIIVNGAKGFAKENLLISRFLQKLLPENPVCAIKGPSFANELIFELPTAFTIASPTQEAYHKIVGTLRKDLIVTDYSNDIDAVEYMSVIKNVYAIVIGVVDAYYNSSNVRFLVFTKVLNEIRRLLQYFGVNPEILFYYCGIGDFGLTALNDLSRNRTLGLLIGRGFFDANLPNSVLLEGVRAMNDIIGSISEKEQENYLILHQMQLLLQNKIKVKNFLNRIIFG